MGQFPLRRTGSIGWHCSHLASDISGDPTLAKPATSRKAPAKAAAGDDNFALRSLQEAHLANPRYTASDEELLAFYEQMLLIRRFEEKAGQMYGMGLIGGFCHLYIGQEAVVVGMQAAMKPGDQCITGYRDHGHMLAYGIDPNLITGTMSPSGSAMAEPIWMCW